MRAVIVSGIALCLTVFAVMNIAYRLSIRQRTVHILTTNDVHGRWYSEQYAGGDNRNSLQNVSWYVDSIRNAVGSKDVILIDAGDCLQGDNAAYYFNYVKTDIRHLYARIATYMGYDAVVVGNHDIETAHPVYDRVLSDMKREGIPFLAGNALCSDLPKAYFPEYTVVRRGGLKVLILGYTNPNIKAWLSEDVWEGIEFQSLIPFVQDRVDAIKAKVKPDVTIVAVHSGNGAGDGSSLESQGLDLLGSLRGVDMIVTAHDHGACVVENDSICLINAGSHARYLGHGIVQVNFENGLETSRLHSAELIKVGTEHIDSVMYKLFHPEWSEVKDFTMREVGTLEMDLNTSDAYRGMCDYLNLIHTVQLKSTGAQVSFAAPLTYKGRVKSGTVVFNDMFTIYPFENQLFTMKLTGSQIKDYLEYSYSQWVCTLRKGSDRVLNIVEKDDPRTGQNRWSFVARSYNFDSAGGINYTVDVTRPEGERVVIKSLADGSPFDSDAEYVVALTSYRANGGGGLLVNGAGLDPDSLPGMVCGRYPEIRELIYRYFQEQGSVDSSSVSDKSVIGEWRFIPEKLAETAMDADFKRLSL